MKAVVIGLVVVLGLLGGFYGGLKYGQAHASSGSPTGDAPPRPGRGGGANFGSAINGPIVSAGNGTITVHDTRTNKNVTVNVSSSATISKVTQGSTSDLTQNHTVTVIGTPNSDGSVNARNIQVGGGGFGRRRASPSPSAATN
jgi:hypothetical protein